MKKFLLKISLFFFTGLILCSISLFLIPEARLKSSMLSAIPDKHKMLAKATSPKIILLGGSNASFGFNSQKIIDAYHRPVVNTGITMDLGLKFIVADIKPYINKGDIIVFPVDYRCYDKSRTPYFDGKEALVPVLFTVLPNELLDTDFDEKMNLLRYLPHYAFSKLKAENLLQVFKITKSKSHYKDIYGRYSFNQYGDTYVHWTLPNKPFLPEGKSNAYEQINPDVVNFLKDFSKYVIAKGATLVMLPIAFQDTSFENQEVFIKKVDSALKKIDLPLATEPSRYKFPDKYFFNSPHHLNKLGVDKQTDMVIEDLAKIISH